MNSRSRREVILLGVLVLLLVAAVIGRRGALYPGSTAAPAGSARATPAAPSKPQPVADVKLDTLEQTRTELDPAVRNPFQFQARSAPSVDRSAGVGRGAPAIAVGPSVPSSPSPLPPIALKYIGVLETNQGRVAVFRGTSGEILNGGEGDIIDGRYRLLQIGMESADIAYADGRGRQTLRLSGQ